MEKLKMHTPDGTKDNIARIGELFPNCITEVKDDKGNVTKAIDFDQLRQELSDSVVDGPRERYHLDWPGKRNALLAANSPIAKTLRPVKRDSVSFDATKNLFIEGDNLDVLKLLQESYLNRIKMVYIDPPYNTGKDFIYKDSFVTSEGEYLSAAGTLDEGGGRLVANTEANGRFHSDWLSMLYPRLKLARNVLSPDGFLFVSIGDHEVSGLRQMCDSVFGEQNFVAELIWNTEGHTDNQYDVKVNHEYILLYAKSPAAVIGNVVDPNTRTESNLWKGYAENSITKNGSGNPPSEILLPAGFPCVADKADLPANEPKVKFYSDVEEVGYITRQLTADYDLSYPIRRDAMTIRGGKLSRPCRVFSGWANADKLKAFIAKGCVPLDEGDGNKLRFFLSENGVIYYRRDRDKARNVVSVLKNMGTTEQMRSELEDMGIPFQYPKPKQLISYLLKMGAESGGIVLDFFSGSCTTAHAVMELCAANRSLPLHFIMVQLPELLLDTDPKQKPGYDFCKALGVPATIAEIGKERIRRTGKKVKDEVRLTNPDFDVGFRVLRVDTSNMKDVYYQPDAVKQETLHGLVDNVKEDRTDEDLLFQVLLDWGVDLTLPIEQEKVKGKSVFFVDTNALAACFEPGIDEAFIKELAKRKPLRAVFRDTGYGSDAAKINVEQIFKLLSPGTEVKSI